MSYANEILQLSTDAEAGDPVAGETLLRLFSTLSKDAAGYQPELVEHVARCVSRFIESDSRTRDALTAFCIARPAHRPSEPRVFERHVKAYTEYLRLRSQAAGKEAAVEGAARTVNLSIASIRKLVEARNPSLFVASMMQFSVAERPALIKLPRKKSITKK